MADPVERDFYPPPPAVETGRPVSTAPPLEDVIAAVMGDHGCPAGTNPMPSAFQASLRGDRRPECLLGGD